MGLEMSLFGREKERTSSRKNSDDGPRWRVASFSDDHEGKKVRKARKVYSIWGAMKYTMVLSLLLWWLPVFGQMIAGYIGGRKAGSPLKGVVSAVLPVVALFAVITALDHLLSQSFSGTSSASSSLLAGFATGIPVIGPYLDFTRSYVMNFLDSLAGSAPYGMNSYIITLAFAYIGGILADQTRREIEAVSGAAGSHTTLVVSPNEYREGAHHMGFPAHNPIPLVSSFVSGKVSAFKPSHATRRRGRANNFDRMVAIRDIEGAREEEEIEPMEASAGKHAKKHVRRVRKLKAPAPRPDDAAHVRRERPNLVVNPAKPNTFRTAQRRIEKEWDPARRMRAAGSPPIIAQKHHQRHEGGALPIQPRPSVARRVPTRNWETI